VDFQDILYEKADGIATITLNRPERLNAFTLSTLKEWGQAITDARVDREVRVVILTGAGRGFCAGADFKGGEPRFGQRGEESSAMLRNFLRDDAHVLTRLIHQLDKPYLAAVNGAAAGAGMDLASMCDIRFASETAKFAMSYVNMGLSPGDGGGWYLPRIVGAAKALEMLWTGEPITAQEALACGYVSRVLPPEELLPATRAFAQKIADGPAVAVQLAKRLVYRGAHQTLDEALEDHDWAMAMAMATEDAKEGPRAFTEKRKPRFQGR